jgi:hypothetical protein
MWDESVLISWPRMAAHPWFLVSRLSLRPASCLVIFIQMERMAILL